MQHSEEHRAFHCEAMPALVRQTRDHVLIAIRRRTVGETSRPRVFALDQTRIPMSKFHSSAFSETYMLKTVTVTLRAATAYLGKV
jgi:hypothetical protein